MIKEIIIFDFDGVLAPEELQETGHTFENVSLMLIR